CAMNSDWGKEVLKKRASILVLPGDQPLISRTLLKKMSEPLSDRKVRLLTCHWEDPTGLGRVVRTSKGEIEKIVEEKDASESERQIHEVALSIYTFPSLFLEKALQNLKSNNAQGELYLTDCIEEAKTSHLA